MGQSQSRGDQSSRADRYSVQQEPDIRPGRLRKCDVISDPKVFEHIDSHVFRAYRSFRSVSETKNFLIQPAKSDLDKVRAFYVYVTSKNRKLPWTNTKEPNNHELFQQLCKEANIPCRSVAGFGKVNASDSAFEASSRGNHCWSLVYVQGQWWHVDCTWGERKTNDKTVSALGEFYFLCDPIDFVQSHLPWEDGDSQASRKLQLLRTPWSLEEFNRHVRVGDKALEFGIRPGTLSHTTARVEMSSELVLEVRADATKMAGLLAELHQNGDPRRGHTLVRDVGGGVYRVRVMPPEQGDYSLRLYGKAQGGGGEFTSILSYDISCHKACNTSLQYPKNQNAQTDVMGRAQSFGITPPAHVLDVLEARGGKLDISLGLTPPIKAKGLLKHAGSESDSEPLDRYVLMTASSNALRIKARFPLAGFYTLQVVVLDSGAKDDSVKLALTLIVRCRKPLRKCHAFPETYPTTTLWQCRLLEPQGGCLPENSVVKVRLTSPRLKRLEPGTLAREGEVWSGLLMTQEPHSTVTLFGSDKMDGPLQSIFKFKVTDVKSKHSVMRSRPLPALLPAKDSRSDVIPNPQKTFKAVDKRACQVPESAKASVPALARRLTKHASNDIAKARAFFCWMAHNIRYDEDVKNQPNDPETVLSRGSAVCKGYSGLFRALCSYVGIPCHFVSGLDKAEESSSRPRAFRLPRASEPLPLTASGQSGHAWNVVLVGGCWRHVDCTWGAGKVKDGAFSSDFQEQYFLTDAEDFVTRHFPLMEGDHEKSARFQLLARPWTLQQFNTRVKPSDSALEFGVQTSHPEAKVVFSGEVELEIRVNAKKMDDLMAELTRGKEDSEVKGHSVVLRAGEGVYKVKVAPRERGRYKLTLLGHPCAGREGAVVAEKAVFFSLLEYELECTMSSFRRRPYPSDHTTAYGATPAARECGLAPGALSTVTSPDGSLDTRLPLSRRVEARAELFFSEDGNADLDRYIRVSTTPKELRLEANLRHPGFYKVVVFALSPSKKSDQDGAKCVLHLLVECQRGKVGCQPFS